MFMCFRFPKARKMENPDTFVLNTNTIVRNNSELNVEKFSTVCRCCLSTNNTTISVFKLKYEQSNFLNIFESCTSVKINEGDLLPHNICFLCVNEIIRIHTFLRKIQDSDKLLKEVLRNHLADKEPTVREPEFITVSVETEQTEPPPNPENVTEKQEPSKLPGVKNKTYVRRTYKCPTCAETFPTFKKTEEHCRETNHPKPRLHKCPMCPKTFTRQAFVRHHLLSHSQVKTFVCDVCGTRLSNKNSLRRHRMIHTGERPHVCEVCGKGFTQSKALTNHKQLHNNETMKTDFVNETFKCSHCDRRFTSSSAYYCHLRRHLDNGGGNGNVANDLELFKYECETCGKLFLRKCTLAQHKVVHDEKKYLCSNCGKSFARKSGLDLHMLIHSGAKPHTCPVCQKTFRQRSALNFHTLSHRGERNYTCNVCDRAFMKMSHVRLHMRTHTGERPFACTFCGKGFALKYNLASHERIHTGERPYACDACGKGFPHMTAMKTHRMRCAKGV